MQVGGALQGGRTIPRRSRLRVLLAIMVIAAMMVLLAWAALASSGVGAEGAKPNTGAGSAIIHDDAGNSHRNAGAAVIHDDADNVHAD